jgi:hypothetical protein
MRNGQPYVRGNLLAAALWILALGAHLGCSYLVGQAQRLDPAAIGQVGRGGI